jgi:hypothetical protein
VWRDRAVDIVGWKSHNFTSSTFVSINNASDTWTTKGSAGGTFVSINNASSSWSSQNEVT